MGARWMGHKTLRVFHDRVASPLVGVWRTRTATRADATGNAGQTLMVLWVTLAGLALRLIRLNFQPLWFDEGYSFYFANSSLAQLIERTSVDIHPPLYYLLLKGWLAVCGSGVAAARCLSVVSGVAAIPLLYLLGRRLWGGRAGLFAALLLALSPFHIYYSQEVRMYGLVTLLGLAASLLTLRAAEGRGRWDWVAAGAALLAGLYTQYYAAFIPAGLTIVLLARRDLRRRLGAWLLTLAGVALAYLPWLIYTGPRLWVYVQYKVGKDADLPLSLWEYLRRVAAAFGAGHLEGGLAACWPAALLPAALALLGLLALGLRRELAGARRGLGFALAYLCAPLAGAFAVNRFAPFNPPRSERLLLIALPAFCLLAGCLLDALWPRRRALAVAGLLLATLLAGASLAGFYSVARYPRDDYRPLIAEVGRRAGPDDAVVCVWPWQVGYFQAYLGARRPALIETPGQIYPQARQFWADAPARMRSDLDALLAQHGRLWLPAYLAAGSAQEMQIAGYLDQIGVRALSDWYGETHLSLHVTAPALAALPANVDFSGRLSLTEARLGGTPAAGAGYLVFAGRWEKRAALDGNWRVALRLTDAAGRSWGQWDAEPLGGERPFSAWEIGESHTLRLALLMEAGAPPGMYQLRLSVRAADATPLPALVAGAPEAEALLTAVTVTRPAAPLAPAALPMQRPVGATFGGALKLLGYSVGAGPFTPGEALKLTLFWQCQRAPGRDLIVFAQLLDGRGGLAAAMEAPPTDGLFATRDWQAGDLIRDPLVLPLPASLPDGEYRLIVGLFDAGDKARLTTPAGLRQRDYVELGRVRTRGRAHDLAAPQPAQALDVRFGDTARLVGYDATRQGGTLRLTLYWQAQREMGQAYTVFVHAYGADGRRVAQHDGTPGGGQLPTTGWVAGEYIPDTHTLELSDEAGALTVWVGLYEPAGGARLPATDVAGAPLGDHALLEVGR